MKINNLKILEEYLDELFPHAQCELLYSKDYELVIAVMLSAQTTDKSVNKCTEVLFKKYKSLIELSSCSIEEIENIIHPLGLYKHKAKNIINIAKKLLNNFDGKVPSNKKDLMTLPGVGNKTSGVILMELYHIPHFPVDTHILRIAKRLKLVQKSATPIEAENELEKLFLKKNWIKLHHQFIHFGRYFCTAKNPNCKKCKICDFCTYK